MTKILKPEINYYEFEYYLENKLEPKLIKNTKIYKLIKKLTSYAYPERLYGDLIWENFYLPIKYYGNLKLIPFALRKYKNRYFAFFSRFGSIEIRKDNIKIEQFYKILFKEVIRFLPFIKKNPDIVEKLVPYYFRDGKIKAKYIMEKTMPRKEAERIKKEYENLIREDIRTEKISLNDYLKVAAICYKFAFKKKARNMNSFDMYKKWADGRDCGMLDIKNKDSKKAYSYWLKHKAHCGGHPFEIVFSWFNHGILLYPPYTEKPYFSICFGNNSYTETYIIIVKALIKNKISFRANGLDKALELLTGERCISVNKRGEDIFTTFFYSHNPSKRKLFKHIEWEKLKVVKFK